MVPAHWQKQKYAFPDIYSILKKSLPVDISTFIPALIAGFVICLKRLKEEHKPKQEREKR